MIEDTIIDKIKAAEFSDFLSWLIETDQEYIIDEFYELHTGYGEVNFDMIENESDEQK